jgi:hypothetical protein
MALWLLHIRGHRPNLLFFLLPFVFEVVNVSRSKEVFPAAVRINKRGFLFFYYLDEPTIDVAI